MESTMALYTFSLVDRLSPLRFQTFFLNLPNAELAFDIWLTTLSSIWTLRDSVLPKYVNLSTWASIALRLPPSAADIYDQPTSISWLYRAVGGLHLAVGLSLLQARRSGTHYRSSFAVCPSVLATLDACWRRYYSRNISALSAVEMLCIILRYINFIFYSILWYHEIGHKKLGQVSPVPTLLFVHKNSRGNLSVM